MVTNNTYEYGIKYRVIKISKDQFMMLPVSLEGGLSDGIDFSTDDGIIPIANEKKDLRKKYVIDNVYTTEELEEIYDYGDDTDFLSSYFYNDYKDIVYLVNVENGQLKKYAIPLSNFKEHEYDLTYHMDKKVPSITLNEDSLNEILASDDPKEMRVLLNKYKQLVKKFSDYNKKGITRINVNNGHVASVETEKSIDEVSPRKKVNNDTDKEKEYLPFGGVDVSYDGLRKAIKEKVFGHDSEIDTIAQKLYMNYTAVDGEPVESILIVGPTGTGKTETVKAASEYLCVPFFEMNASNLVPQGIKGTSIEDVVIALYELSDLNIKRAERGIVLLDEYDKIDFSDLDIKKAIRPILLSFNDGGKIVIKNEVYDIIFNTKMTNKMYAGVFDRIYQNGHTIGFGVTDNNNPLHDDKEIRQRIIDKGYFTLEELSRIPKIIPYNELSRDTKKQILLFSKLSAFVKKRDRYKRQFGIDLKISDDYIDAILDTLTDKSEGMRSVNNFVKDSIDEAEKAILENERKGYKTLTLTKETALDPKKFDMS